MSMCVESGIIGQDLEAQLLQLGLTTGHEPDSLEFSRFVNQLILIYFATNCKHKGPFEIKFYKNQPYTQLQCWWLGVNSSLWNEKKSVWKHRGSRRTRSFCDLFGCDGKAELGAKNLMRPRF